VAISFLQQEGERERLVRLLARPEWLAAVTLLYTASFLLKGWAWRLYTDGRISGRTALAGLYASLFVNHVLPVKAGDLVRAGAAARGRGRLSWDEALHSVAALRSLDLLTLGAFAASGAVYYGQGDALELRWYAVAACAAAIAAGIVIWAGPRLRLKAASFIGKHGGMARSVLTGRRGWAILLLTAASWTLEGAVVYGAAQVLGIQLGIAAAIWVTSVTVAGQVFHFTPGGIGTYESVMSAMLAAGLGIPLEEAFAVALATHGFKFLYSYAAGGILLWQAAVSWKEIRGWTAMRGRLWPLKQKEGGRLL
jgi:uncharacterized membrane protein YbhN (UPF0104 family)